MSRFVLQPCKLRGDRIAVDKSAEQLVIKNKPDLLARFRATTQAHFVQLRQIRPGCFLGLVEGSRSKQIIPFLIWNHDRSNRVRWVFNQDPQFGDRLLEVFRVEEVDWGSSVQEVESGKKDMPTWKARKNVPLMEA